MVKGTEIKANPFPLNTKELHPRAKTTRIHIVVYTCAIIALFYHHLMHLLHPMTPTHLFFYLALYSSDVILAFMWLISQSFRWRPIRRKVFPENLHHIIDDKDLPALDIFICTADPCKEPPINTASTALSVLAYDYPTNKISVYVSDDGGSPLTLFALMQASKFAKHWLPFCKEHRVTTRCPHEFFNGDEEVSSCSCSMEELERIKMLYQKMKASVEAVMEQGHIDSDMISSDKEREAFSKWTTEFSRQDHPTIIEVVLQSDEDVDVSGGCMPNLVYLSREKSQACHHNFKAGALNALIRVSAKMTNAPVLLSLDCDMFSNDPKTPRKALCHFLDPLEGSKLAFVQFPQRYKGINRSDIYNNELNRGFRINAAGLDGLGVANYVGTGSFIRRTALYGSPSQLDHHQAVLGSHISDAGNHSSISSGPILEISHDVASCNHEQGTNWGVTMGYRYGTLVEDFFTGYRLQCEGWCSILCDPSRAAFLGDFPITLNDTLIQMKRWLVGFLEVLFSKYCPFTYGTTRRNLLMGMGYGFYCCWPFWSIPILAYGLLPPLGLLYDINLFPKVSDPWFYLYMYLFIASYTQDLIENLLYGTTLRKWWSEQRMWMIRGVTSYPFSLIEFSIKNIGISTPDFNVTSKVIDNEQQERYNQGVFDFGVETPFFMPLLTVAVHNLIAFTCGLVKVMQGKNLDEKFVQLFISGFVVLNALPIYDAMVLRRDGGSIPRKISLFSSFLAWVLS